MTTNGRLRTVPGTLSEGAGISLGHLAAAVPADQAIVDVGIDRGRSTCYLAAGARAGNGAHVYGFDSSWGPRGRQLALLSVRQQGLRGQVTLLDEKTLPAGWRPKVGLLHVNGHRDAVQAAVEAWGPRLADDGRVAYEAEGGLETLAAPKATPPEQPSEPPPKQEDPPRLGPPPTPQPAPLHPAVVEFGTSEVLPEPTGDGLDGLTIAQLRKLARGEGVALRSDMRKREIVEAVRDRRATASPSRPRSRPTRSGRDTSRSSSTG